jgi:hypothetical protein
MLSNVIFANRCVTPGNIGIKMRGNPTMIFIPTGGDNHSLSGDPEFFTHGMVKHAFAGPIEGQVGDLVVVTELGTTLKITVAHRGAPEKVFITSAGVPDVAATPNNALQGLADEQLSVDELGTRFINRLHTIAENEFEKPASKMFFASAAIEGDDKFDALMTSLSAMGSDPKKEAEKGTVPACSRVQVIPGYTKADLPAQLSRLDKARAAVGLYMNIWSIAMRTKRGHPEAYKISVPAEASQLNADLADAASSCLAGPLSGYVTTTNSLANRIDKEMFSTEIHLEFLEKVFSGFSFSEADKKEMDSVLTTVAQTLASLQISSTSSDSSLNHTILNTTVKEIVLVGNDGKEEVIGYEPIVRLTYLHVAQSSWSVSMGKSSAQKVHFEMDYTDITFTLNLETFDPFAAKLDDVISKLLGKNTEEFGKGIVSGTATGTAPK